MCQVADIEQEEELPLSETRLQRTIGRSVSFSGVGVHTGESVQLRLIPADPGTGIVFKRNDLPGQPLIPATVEYAEGVARQTTLSVGDAVVQTPEHVLSALKAFEIDNAIIELSGGEPPVGDGSSEPFVQMIDGADIVEQEGATTPIVRLTEPVCYSSGETHLIALPSDEFRVSYTMHYPNSSVLGSQYLSLPITTETFKTQIGMCRTFCLYEEISFLIDQGLIKGGTLDNAVVIKEDAVLSKGGLRHPDEPVRHKILDLIGDLSLIGIPLLTHIIAIKTGHKSNVAFAKKLYNHIMRGL